MEHSLHFIEKQQQQNLQTCQPSHSSLVIPSSINRSPTVSTQFPGVFNLQIPTVLNSTMSSIEQQLSQSYLSNRLSITSNYSLKPTEIRLFHTLHYLILHSNETNDLPCSLNTIQLFIYLIIPYIHTYLYGNEREFLSNPDLAQGMKLIWQPLFEYHQPNIHLFNAFVKPLTMKHNQQEERICTDNNNQPIRSSIAIQSSMKNSLVKNEHLSDSKRQSVLQEPINCGDPSDASASQSKISLERKQSVNKFIRTNSDTATATATTKHYSRVELLNNGIINNVEKGKAPLVHMRSICSMSNTSQSTIPTEASG